MAHPYYCTFCGKFLNQETVLFDMGPLLTRGTSNKLPILSFLLKKIELEELVYKGIPVDMEFRKCSLTLRELMGYVANANNLREPRIAQLSLDDILSYTKLPDTPVGSYVESSETKIEKTNAILALEQKDTSNRNAEYTEETLRKELLLLRNLFSELQDDKYSEKLYEFDIRPLYEDDDAGGSVLTGYYLRDNSRTIHRPNVRICPRCKASIFEFAGTAEHKMVSFIGNQKAGKTCTILALAHYAQNALNEASVRDGAAGEIWKNVDPIQSVASIELVSPDKRLEDDLKNYPNGIAPPKTESAGVVRDRSNLYSATFWIENRAQTGRRHLLTLVDIPGDKFEDETGRVKSEEIWNDVQAPMAGDVFLLCFDAKSVGQNGSQRLISNVCSWADQFQQLRARFKGETGYAPVMVLFTKDSDLEKGFVKEGRPTLDRIAKTYIFDEERTQINLNAVYNSVRRTMTSYRHLQKIFLASLRCSPFGFEAPDQDQIARGEKTNLDENGRVIRPQPKHIAELMRWILSVLGCIPTDAAYQPFANNPTQVFQPNANFVTRPQYRPMRPAGVGRNADVLEALSRCYLFENPGRWDQELLRYYDQPALLTTVRLRAKLRPEND